ncbi:MAG: DUF3592 domain-containing protein [Planctomycetota bacterium]|jgi:hypothetical protein
MVKFSFGDQSDSRATRDKSSSIVGRIIGTLIFLGFFAIGTTIEVFIIKDLARAIGQRFWIQTPCKILESTVEEDHKRSNPFKFKVRYEYEFNGSKHISETYKRSHGRSEEYHKADKIRQRFPAGHDALCYVNPKNPAEAVLKRSTLLFALVIPLPLIFVLVGAGGMLVCIFAREQKKGKTIPIAPKRRRKKYKYVGIVFFAIFALAGAGMLYPVTIRPIAKTIDASNWIETPCKIIYAKVRTHRGDDSTTYSIDIFYEYQFDGQTCKSSRYGFIGGSSSGRAAKAEVVNHYKKAKNPVCYVNPKDPNEAVLKRGFRLGLLIGLAPFPFLAIGIGGIIACIRKKKLDTKSTGAQPYSADVSTTDFSTPRYTSAGPVILKARYSPLVKFFGALALAVFWNGIVSIFVYEAIRSFQRGRPEWGLSIAMIFFVLAGLAIISLAIHQFLALFNPRVTLRLSSAVIPLGGVAELSWIVSGKKEAVDNFKITLQGREEATYQRGTDTVTARNKFYDFELFSTTNAAQIARGSAGVIIPENLMHSFEAPNNKIIWELEVHGEIDNWPDIKQKHKIQITPKSIDD